MVENDSKTLIRSTSNKNYWKVWLGNSLALCPIFQNKIVGIPAKLPSSAKPSLSDKKITDTEIFKKSFEPINLYFLLRNEFKDTPDPHSTHNQVFCASKFEKNSDIDVYHALYQRNMNNDPTRKEIEVNLNLDWTSRFLREHLFRV